MLMKAQGLYGGTTWRGAEWKQPNKLHANSRVDKCL
jgi:hypothetical protein